jgi:murein DD-endopeptidase MepM/ murein hydrolase activator NlpD
MEVSRRVLAAMVAAAVTMMLAPATAYAQSVYPLIFPVIGEVHIADNFGAPRGDHTHEGVDIMTRINGVAAKGHPVVAASSGVVDWIGTSCCYLAIEHDDGWSSWYIHLNNDTPGTDDGQGWGIAPGIARGTRVEAGQLIGWAGDSGNAENTAPHLHFELRRPDGVAIDAYDALIAAPRLTEPGGSVPDPPCPEGSICDTVAFQDSGGRFHMWTELAHGADVNRFFYGNPGDYPFTGDWDCDGVATPGLYRTSDGFAYLRNSNTEGVADITFFFGNPGDIPVAGDFDNDGCDTVSIYRPSEARFYIINELGQNGGGLGAAEYDFFFGNVGDKPFTGDFDGDGIDTVGLHRESSGFLYFRNTNTSGVADFAFFYGNPNDILFAGDWDGDGVDTLAVYRRSSGTLYVRNSNSEGTADFSLFVGSFVGAVTIGDD